MTRLALLGALLLAACTSEPTKPDLKPTDGWARETADGQTSAAAYLTVINNGTGNDRLIGISTDAAAHGMIHSTSTDEHGVSQMRHMDGGLDIPAKTAVELAPGRNHIMLTGLKQPLKRGQELAIDLRFEESGRKRAMIKILDPASAGLQETR